MSLFPFSERFRDRRRSIRNEAQYPAQIDIGDTGPPLSCIISDMSASGAKLTIGTRQQVPNEITLTFRRRCRVVRRSDGQIGVEFV